MFYSILLFAYLSQLSLADVTFKEFCTSDLEASRITIENVAPRLREEEGQRSKNQFLKNMQKFRKILEEPSSESDDAPPTFSYCPQPNGTIMFTTAAPADGGAKSANKALFSAPTLYDTDADKDPYAQWMNTLHYYMSNPNKVCEGPDFKDLNTITEEQFFGFFTNLAAAHPGPFCNLCHRFVNEAEERIFRLSQIMLTPEEYAMRKMLYSFVPTAKSLCSAVAPACYDNYEVLAANITDAVICGECAGCMIVTNLIQHRFLLESSVVASFLQYLQATLFHNVCAELCNAYHNNNQTFSYTGCMTFSSQAYTYVIDVATVILRPERFCSLELGWCELNEVPNGLHCLRELCEEALGNTPATQFLCSQIPDRPSEADAFLNIQATKIYKNRKEYHSKYIENPHIEL